jgi:[acyl-carrier-protein] S-malonyltransferase
MWSESVEQMVGMGTELFLEIGPGKVLRGLIRRIAPQVENLNVGGLEALEAVSARYGEDTSEPQSMEGSA